MQWNLLCSTWSICSDFCIGTDVPEDGFAQTPCYPVFGVLVLGEVINYLSGISRTEFIEDVLGEDEESFKVANYGLLKDILKDLFGERVLYDATVDSGLDVSSSFETLEEMKKSEKSGHPQSGRIFHKAKGKRSGCRTKLCKKLC